ncbi:MAG: hypothetical protein IK008_02040 [Bacteroidales bacterium]|nr:hypothetical protein [Bacteroidales bacterium]
MDKIRSSFSPVVLAINTILILVGIGLSTYSLIKAPAFGLIETLTFIELVLLLAFWVLVMVSYFSCAEDFNALMICYAICLGMVAAYWLLLSWNSLIIVGLIPFFVLFVTIVECIACNNPHEKLSLTKLDKIIAFPLLGLNFLGLVAIALIFFKVIPLQ